MNCADWQDDKIRIPLIPIPSEGHGASGRKPMLEFICPLEGLSIDARWKNHLRKLHWSESRRKAHLMADAEHEALQ